MYKKVKLSCGGFCEAVSSCDVTATQNEWGFIIMVGGSGHNGIPRLNKCSG